MWLDVVIWERKTYGGWVLATEDQVVKMEKVCLEAAGFKARDKALNSQRLVAIKKKKKPAMKGKITYCMGWWLGLELNILQILGM